MARWTGFFNSSGSPGAKNLLCGAAKQASKEFEAIVDTGFTGFLAMSMVEAFPLGLILTGCSKTILADGSATNDLTALGTVVVGNEERVGIILLSTAAGAILAAWSF
jgi:predicted aspartyl protease